MKKRLPTKRAILVLLPLMLCGLGACNSPPSDVDSDGIGDLVDNCPQVFNPNQEDADQDGVGDICEAIQGCGDGVCDPEAGECDVFKYCQKDCTRSRCFGLPDGSTCGDGICDPLAGECSDSGPCLKDCPTPSACNPGTCGNGVCEPWERDTTSEVAFCPDDCACLVNRVDGDCQADIDCADSLGTVCGPDHFPQNAESFQDFVNQLLDIPCQCTTCGNGKFDAGEGCDPSAGDTGLRQCLESGGGCDSITCECFGGMLCPNGQLDPGEECDTGGGFPLQQGSCQNGFVCIPEQCKCSQCGNGQLDTGEECDSGGEIGSSPDCDAIDANMICRANCQCSLCGNGQIDAGEDCDLNQSTPLSGACQQLGFCPSNCICTI